MLVVIFMLSEEILFVIGMVSFVFDIFNRFCDMLFFFDFIIMVVGLKKE